MARRLFPDLVAAIEGGAFQPVVDAWADAKPLLRRALTIYRTRPDMRHAARHAIEDLRHARLDAVDPAIVDDLDANARTADLERTEAAEEENPGPEPTFQTPRGGTGRDRSPSPLTALLLASLVCAPSAPPAPPRLQSTPGLRTA